MPWTWITRHKSGQYFRLASRRGRLALAELFTRLPDGRNATVQVWSRDGANLLRRDTIWHSIEGDGVICTSTYFVSHEIFRMRFCGERHGICAECGGICCEDAHTAIPFAPDEVSAIRAGIVGWPMERAKGGEYRLRRGSDGRCVYLTAAGRCGIYKKHRPRACRLWFCGRGTKDDKDWRTISSNVDFERAKHVGGANAA